MCANAFLNVQKISSVYPEIEWFRVCEIEFIESIFENI